MRRRLPPSRIEIMGDLAHVHLINGEIAIIDTADAEIVAAYRWRARSTRWVTYACAAALKGDPTRFVDMHRLILGFTKGDGRAVDHADRNGLNNTRQNLRPCTNQLNAANSNFPAGVSGFRGVQRSKARWRAQIKVDGRSIHLGNFATPEVAEAAYDEAAARYFGDFAALNFPPRAVA